MEVFIANAQQGIINLATAAVIWFVGRWVIRRLEGVVARQLGRGTLDPTLQRWAASGISVGLTIFLVIAILNVVGSRRPALRP